LNRSGFIKNKFAFLYPAVAVLIGLMAAQLIATLQVYLSNTELFQTLLLLKSQGYFFVPNQFIMDQLGQFKPAFLGGLFFTATVGAGLSVFTFAAVWSWQHFFNKNKKMGVALILVWVICVLALNRKGFCLVSTLYFLIIPMFLFMLMMKWDKRSKHAMTSIQWLSPVFSVIILAMLWTSQMSSSLFLDIRDNLLFSSSLGRVFNDFYYKYTLYPAKVFKSLDQQMLKTCRITNLQDKKTEKTIEKLLINRDYLRIRSPEPVDLDITGQGDTLIFFHKGKAFLNTASNVFITDPDHFLERVSIKTDRYGFFRQATFVGLLIGFPLVLFIFIYSFFALSCSFFTSNNTASILSSTLCVLISIGIFFLFAVNKSTLVDKNNISSVLISDRWQDRVSGLKTVIHYHMEVNPIRTNPNLLYDSHIPVRYWLAKTLAIHRNHQAFESILILLNDPQPNVVCMALEALAGQREKNTIDLLIQKINTTDHWYIQWYAYNALRKLGWNQSESK